MTQVIVVLKPHQAKRTTSASLPALIAGDGPQAARLFIEFFTADIRDPNTRRAHNRAVTDFLIWCKQHRLEDLVNIQPIHGAAYWKNSCAGSSSLRSDRAWPLSAYSSIGWSSARSCR